MFEQLTDHIFYRPHDPYTDRPNIGLVFGNRYALLFDAGNSTANVNLLRQELKSSDLPLPDFVAISHWHWDHTFGMGAWGVPCIAVEQTNRQLKKMQGWTWDDASMQQRLDTREDIAFCSKMIEREYPDRSQIHVVTADIVFESRLELDLGGVTCELIHAGGPHSADSVICYVPQDRFVLLGDSNGKNLYGMEWEFDMAREHELVETLQKLPYERQKVTEYTALLDKLDFSHCVGGHDLPMSKTELYASLK